MKNCARSGDFSRVFKQTTEVVTTRFSATEISEVCYMTGVMPVDDGTHACFVILVICGTPIENGALLE
jgi:hypothetical protein